MAQLIIKTNPATPQVLRKREEDMAKVEEMCKSQTEWYKFETAADYQRARQEGTHGFKKPPIYEQAATITVPARDGHQIELRIVKSNQSTKNVLLHFHAGGFVIGSARSYDDYLVQLATSLKLVVVSVEYRLAPEDPYPAGHYDCLDAALFALSSDGEVQLGGQLRILGGESAGGSLAIWVALALRDECEIDVRSRIAAVLPSYAIFDLTYCPSLLRHGRGAVLSQHGMKQFIEATYSHISILERKDPKISSLYADLNNMPPALFLCGTEDPLVDDSVFMATRWSQAGNQTEICLIPGAWHAFTIIPSGEITQEGLAEIISFSRKHLKTNA